MEVQSGSSRVLKAMRRSYRRDRYLGILDRVRAAMPDAAITTDIIVGFPGETEDDFQQTLDVVREARFSGAYTFLYSQRPGTPAALMPDQPDRAVQHDRDVLQPVFDDRRHGHGEHHVDFVYALADDGECVVGRVAARAVARRNAGGR